MPISSSDQAVSFAFAATGTNMLLWCAVLIRTNMIPSFCFAAWCSRAAWSLTFLVAISISKTLLTKYVFEHVPTPVAMSMLSCVVTGLCLVPILLRRGQLHLLRRAQVPRLSLVCAAVVADLACTNIGLSLLPIAFQQSIKATLPAVTVALDFLVRQRRQSCGVVLVVLGTCLGPVILSADKDWSGSDAGQLWYGVVMMVGAVVGGALKYVLAHDVIKRYKSEMGVLGFTLWMEILSALLLVPWALWNDELHTLFAQPRTEAQWALLLGTAAFGGVRVIAQFCFLEQTSATSLATSNVVIQVGLVLLGTLLFHDVITTPLIAGTVVTVLMSSTYAYMKHKESSNTEETPMITKR